MQRAVYARGLRHGRHFLHVVRNDDARHGAHGLGDAEGAVGNVAHLCVAAHHLYIVARHVLEQRYQIDFLLIVAAESRQLLLADDGDHGLVIELGVVKSVQQMNRARARGGEAHADFAGELGVCASHERSHLFMTRLHESDIPLNALERAHDAVDAVAGIAVDAAHTPLPQTLQEKVGGGVAHTMPPCFSCALTVVTAACCALRAKRRGATDMPRTSLRVAYCQHGWQGNGLRVSPACSAAHAPPAWHPPRKNSWPLVMAAL